MKTIIVAICLSLSGVLCAAQDGKTARTKTQRAHDEKLISCVKNGDEECVARELAAGADVDAVGEKGLTALPLASEGDSVNIVASLLDAGADVNGNQQGGGSPLCRAALFGRKEIVEKLLAKGANVKVVCDSDHGDTPLMTALRGAMFGELPDELKEELTPSRDDANETDEVGSEAEKVRAVLNAPRDNFLHIARLLLARGADVNAVAKCDVGETALMYAAIVADVEMVKELLSHGADVNKGTSVLILLQGYEREYEKTKGLALPAISKEQSAMLAWSEATRAPREQINQLLKAAGAKEVESDEDAGDKSAESDTKNAEEAASDAFTSAIEKNDAKDFARLVESYAAYPLGARVLPEALRSAVIYDRTEMVKLLLARGVDPNGGEWAPLIHAANDGKLEYVLMLLEAGANVNATDNSGRTALDYAEGRVGLSEERRAVVEVLKARGATSKRRK